MRSRSTAHIPDAFVQQMPRWGVLGQSLVISAARTDKEIDLTVEATAGAVEVFPRDVEAWTAAGLLEGRPVPPATREFAELRRMKTE